MTYANQTLHGSNGMPGWTMPMSECVAPEHLRYPQSVPEALSGRGAEPPVLPTSVDGSVPRPPRRAPVLPNRVDEPSSVKPSVPRPPRWMPKGRFHRHFCDEAMNRSAGVAYGVRAVHQCFPDGSMSRPAVLPRRRHGSVPRHPRRTPKEPTHGHFRDEAVHRSASVAHGMRAVHRCSQMGR